jgi:hypothetical protein
MRQNFTALAALSTWFGFCASAVASNTTPFTPQTNEFAFAATTSAGTPIQIAPLSGGATTYTQYRIAAVCSSPTAVVSLAMGSTQASVAAPAVPTAGTPQYTLTIPCGPAIEVRGAPPQAWLNAITSSGTATLYVTGGEGL